MSKVAGIILSASLLAACGAADPSRCTFSGVAKEDYVSAFPTADGEGQCRTGELDLSTIPDLSTENLAAWQAHYEHCQAYAYRCEKRADAQAVHDLQLAEAFRIQALIAVERAQRGDAEAAVEAAGLNQTYALFEPAVADYWARVALKQGDADVQTRAREILADLAARKVEGYSVPWSATPWAPPWWEDAEAVRGRDARLLAYRFELARRKATTPPPPAS